MAHNHAYKKTKDTVATTRSNGGKNKVATKFGKLSTSSTQKVHRDQMRRHPSPIRQEQPIECQQGPSTI